GRDEIFGIVLGAPVNATVAPGRDTTTVTIVDDDGGASDSTPPRLQIGALRAAGARVTATVRCPRTEHLCRGALTLFTVPSARSPITALHEERRLARATYRLAGGAARRLTLRLSATNRHLLKEARTVRVRAFAVATDANGNVGNASRGATLHFG